MRAVRGHIALLELVRSHDAHIARSTPAELLELVGTDDQLALTFAALAAGTAAGAALTRYAGAVRATRLALTGHDLLALGVERGPAVGRVLDELYRRKLMGELPDAADERALVSSLVGTGDKGTL